MVLEDNEKSAPKGYNDNTYRSEDHYATALSSPTVRFDPSSFPQPLPILGKFWGFSQSFVHFRVMTTLEMSERQIGRMLNSDEAQAMAFHLYQMEQTSSYWAAYGAAAGAYRCWSTAAKMRYPFYQPDLGKIDRNKFVIFRGPNAMLARHAFRFSLFVIGAGHFGGLIGRILSHPKAVENMSKDTRLEHFTRGIDIPAEKKAKGHETGRLGNHAKESGVC